MKNLSKRLSIATLLLSFLTCFSWGQDKPDLNFSKKIMLKSESEGQMVPLAVSENCTSLNLSIAAKIQEGELTIEIYDPKGEKQGNFSIECHSDTLKTNKGKTHSESSSGSNSKTSSSSSSSSSTLTLASTSLSSSSSTSSVGLFTKSLKNPTNGDWMIKIIPKNASGEVKIDSEQKTQ
jgi:hypothetical protein